MGRCSGYSALILGQNLQSTLVIVVGNLAQGTVKVLFACTSAPVLFHAFTVRLCVPVTSAAVQESVFVAEEHLATPST
jgi:hypothetical protein